MKKILLQFFYTTLILLFILENAFATSHLFPEFNSETCDWIGGEWVYTIDTFNGVPAYLNSANNGSGGSDGSFYQCTEYVGRYLYTKFNINYTNVKDINNSDTQGFNLYQNGFEISYSSLPNTPPWVKVKYKDGTEQKISLRRIIPQNVQLGDIVAFTLGHVAIIKAINGEALTLTEQNWVYPDNGKWYYEDNREINRNDSNTYFFRYNPIGHYSNGWHSDGSSQVFLDTYARNGSGEELGYPCDHGGGEWVHNYAFTDNNGNTIMVYLQDVCHETKGQKTISYLPGAGEAYLLEGCLGYLWWQEMPGHTIKYQSILGAPISDEIKDTSQFPAERDDGFEVMQEFQYGKMFWKPGTVRIKMNDERTCEDYCSDVICGSASTQSYEQQIFSIQQYDQQSEVWPTCAQLLSNPIPHDTTPPTRPNAPQDTGYQTTSISLTFSWNPSTDSESGIRGYNLTVNSYANWADALADVNGDNIYSSVFIGNVTSYTLNVGSSQAGRVIKAAVMAIDNAGNVSNWSNLSDGIEIVIEPITSWEFSTFNNFEGWSVSGTSASAVDHWPTGSDPIHLIVNPATDPYIYSPELSVNSSNYSAVEFRMNSYANDNQGQVFFKTSGGYTEGNSVLFPVRNDSLWHTYLIKLGDQTGWSGTITGIRIDPAANGNGSYDDIAFDSIRLVNFAGLTEGALVRTVGTNQVYQFKGDRKWGIVSDTIFNALGFSWEDIVDLSPGILNQYANGPNIVSDGSLIRREGENEVYLIENGQRRWITNPEVFNQMGFSWEDIYDVPTERWGALTALFPEGSPISGTIPAPTGVSASDGVYTDKVRITWNSVSGANYYRVFRSTLSDPIYATTLGNWQSSTIYDDYTATPGQIYYYWVRAGTDNTGTNVSDLSSSDTGWQALPPPQNVAASDGGFYDKVRVGWNTVFGANHYRVYRNSADNPSTATAISGWQSSNVYDDTTATPDTTYYYWVKAATDSSGSNASDFSGYDTGYRTASTNLNCTNAIPLISGVPYSGTTVGASSNVNSYNCSAHDESGPEVVHTITTTSQGNIYAKLSNLSEDLNVYILDACDTNSCLASADNTASYEDVPPGTYYIVVEGYQGASGSYTLTVTSSPLSQIAGVSASDGTYSDKVRITWLGKYGATHYRVYRNITNDPYSAEALGNWQSSEMYDDTEALAGVIYYYWVKGATGSSGENASIFSASDTGYRASPTLFTEMTDITSIAPAGVSSVGWGDYDNDGDLDILLIGDGPSDYISKVYRNDGGGTFTDINASLTPVASGSVDWGDYDNDGDLDILLTGYSITPLSKVYRNDGGTFTDINADLAGVWTSSAVWGDYDNDGDLDILLTGNSGSEKITQVYQNNGDGAFTDMNTSLPNVSASSVTWGDYDTDGDLDILLTGSTPYSGRISEVYRNDGGGTFTDINAGLTGIWQGSVAWGDYDNDADLDILLAGGSILGDISKVYRNDGGGTFIDINAGLEDSQLSSVAWGDYDNDGDLDILIAGDSFSSDDLSQVYRNDNGTFTNINAGLTGIHEGSVVWGDYDNDGDLDILLVGRNESSTRVSKVYRNNTTSANTVPTTPTNLNSSVAGDVVTLSWNPVSDAQTSQNGLTYNLRIGTIPGGSEISSAMADNTNGYRRVVQLGNTNHNTSWTIKNLPGGTYYWSVQAIDTAFAGSLFASGGTFTIGSTVPEINVKQGTTDIPSGTGSYDFGSVNLGSSSSVTFTIENTGSANLLLTGTPIVQVGGANPGDFSVTQPTTSTAAPASSVTFAITFTPQATGIHTAELSIANNDNDEDPYTFTVSGTGQTPGVEPQLVSSSPANGATNVPVLNRIISFTFDQRMQEGYSVTWSGIGVTPSFVSWSADGKTIYFVYPSNLPAGRTIGCVLNPSTHEPNFKSEDGVSLPADQYSGSFSTETTPTPTQFTIEVSVQHYMGENYFLGINVIGGTFSSVDIIGPYITSVWQQPQTSNHIVVSLSDRPNTGNTYAICIYYDTTFEDKTYSVDGMNDNFAWILSPADGATVSTLTPTFTWQEANNISSYSLIVEDDQGNSIWYASFPVGVSSCVYNFDGSATASLQSGETYNVYLHTYDANGHQATSYSTFTVQAPQASNSYILWTK